jgi:ribonuclease P protein component
MAGAVERNRVRRRLREAARELRGHHGYDLIVSGDAMALRVPFALLREQVETAARLAVARASVAAHPVPVAPAPGSGPGRP